MTAVVKSRGIWVGGPQVKEPRVRLEVPSSRLDYVYYTLFASEAQHTRVGIFIDGAETADVTVADIQTNVFERYGKEQIHYFTYPEAKKTAGVHKIVIKTGVTGASDWHWTSEEYEIIIPVSAAAPEE